jgi:hypothetical protein
MTNEAQKIAAWIRAEGKALEVEFQDEPAFSAEMMMVAKVIHEELAIAIEEGLYQNELC